MRLPFCPLRVIVLLEHWENPRTKLVDERWLELILAKLRDIHHFQDKKQKLTSSGRKSEDSTGAAEKDKEKDTKKKKKGGVKGGGKGSEERRRKPLPKLEFQSA